MNVIVVDVGLKPPHLLLNQLIAHLQPFLEFIHGILNLFISSHRHFLFQFLVVLLHYFGIMGMHFHLVHLLLHGLHFRHDFVPESCHVHLGLEVLESDLIHLYVYARHSLLLILAYLCTTAVTATTRLHAIASGGRTIHSPRKILIVTPGTSLGPIRAI